MSGHADTLRWEDSGGATVVEASDYDALLAENQRNAHKVAAYDAARATVKIEGQTRSYYVLRAERAEAENQRLRDALEEITDFDFAEFVGPPILKMQGIARRALAGDAE